jgi:predicted DNA-binding antitoxin AbrB/MazE fold protein
MLGQHIDAVYEAGMLRPLAPLDLAEHERVSLIIARNEEQEANASSTSDDYLPLISEDGDPSITWEQVQTLLAKLPGSLSTDFDRARDERF